MLNRDPFKFVLLFFALSFYCLVNFTFGSDKMVEKVKGLLYSDGIPVTIEIVDGKIYKIIRKALLEGSDKSNLYVAPGLIDNQINGFASVGFSSPGLIVRHSQSDEFSPENWRHDLSPDIRKSVCVNHDCFPGVSNDAHVFGNNHDHHFTESKKYNKET